MTGKISALIFTLLLTVPIQARSQDCASLFNQPDDSPLNTVPGWTNEEKESALDIMLAGSQMISRTVSHGRRFIAPATLPDSEISSLAESNFQKTARYVLDHLDELTIDKKTAIELNRMLTEGLVPENVRGDPFYRIFGSYIDQTDVFVGGDPAHFYKWLDSDAANELRLLDPVAFAEVLHNNIVALDSFPDGNGRLSRIFADLALMKSGLAPAYYTDMQDYFNRGDARSPVDRAARKAYFREIVEKGQRALAARHRKAA